MVGPCRGSFDFLEIEGYTPEFTPHRPCESWGSDYVYLLADGDFISLHLLEEFDAR